MKYTILCTASAALLAAALASADSTIDATNKFAYGANIGWINFRHDQPNSPNGVVVGSTFLSGFAYSANCGWIDFGDGTPDDRVSYSNISATDFGVNHDGAGKLTGFAYGANIGWINFEQTRGRPRINLATGAFSGFAWSANCGWINLGTGNLVTNRIDQGPDSDNDMIADAWEFEQGAANGTPNDLRLLGKTGDADRDGVSDLEEYQADSNPFDPRDYLRLTSIDAEGGAAENIFLEWTSSERRIYDVQKSTDLATPFADLSSQTSLRGASGTTSTTFTDLLRIRNYYRIEARVPLAP